MKPYYSDEHVTLYLGDANEHHELWTHADVMITDPPYGIGWKIGNHPKRKSVKHEGIANDQDTTARDRALEAFGPKPAIVFGTWAEQIPEAKQTLVWLKPADAGVIGSTTGYRRDTELIFLLGPHPKRSAARSSVIHTSAGKASYLNGHPHAKPEHLMRDLITWTEGTVADPFSGSGSTLVAAKQLNREAVGFEINEKYAELTARRLSQQTLDLGI